MALMNMTQESGECLALKEKLRKPKFFLLYIMEQRSIILRWYGGKLFEPDLLR